MSIRRVARGGGGEGGRGKQGGGGGGGGGGGWGVAGLRSDSVIDKIATGTIEASRPGVLPFPCAIGSPSGAFLAP